MALLRRTARGHLLGTAPFLLASLFAAGCSFPTSEFTLRPGPTTDVPPSDTGRPPGDTPPTDSNVPVDVVQSDTGPACGADGQPCCTATSPGGAAACDPGLSCNAMTRCVSACPSGQVSCNGVCTDLNADPNNCGLCGNRCAGGANGAPGCMTGACRVQCNTGWADCDADPSNGCEADTRTSVSNCGACGNSCALPNATATCTAGACAVMACEGTFFRDCDGMASNGCETDTRATNAHCGMCGRACAAGQYCAGSACRAMCEAVTGYRLCGTPSVCVNTYADPNHCNGCGTMPATGTTCSARANATRTCTQPVGATMGVCGFVCNANYGNCDGMEGNGCETDLRANSQHCNACGRRCDGGPNATPRCAAGICRLACNMGYGDCDGMASTGCETALNTTDNCGACGRTCNLANAVSRCGDGGACAVVSCSPGWSDCDMNPANGCETDTRTNPYHCGRCTNACPAPTGRMNSAAVCASGTCSVACQPYYGDCDANPTNGCETSLATNVNCGACGVACGARACVCTNRTCACQ